MSIRARVSHKDTVRCMAPLDLYSKALQGGVITVDYRRVVLAQTHIYLRQLHPGASFLAVRELMRRENMESYTLAQVQFFWNIG